MTYLPDVNVWVALSAESHKHHNQARLWLNKLQEEKLVFCRLTQLGLLRLLTNRHVMGEEVVSPEGAWSIYKSLRSDRRVGYRDEPFALLEEWVNFAPTQSGSPNLWTDAYLSAYCFASRLTLVTFDLRIPPRDGVGLLRLQES